MHEESRLQRELADCGRLLLHYGLVHTTLGTISAILDNDTRICLVKPATLNYRNAQAGSFARVNLQNELLDPTSSPPSLNFLVHIACYLARPDIGAVIHTHPESVVKLISGRHSVWRKILKQKSDCPRYIPLTSEESVWFTKPSPKGSGGIPIVSDLRPKELARAVGQAVHSADVVAIRNHGLIAVGHTLEDALNATLAADSEARVLFDRISGGFIPNIRNISKIRQDLACMPPYITLQLNRNMRR